MLVNFRFKNCRSFYDETILSMQATSDEAYRELNTFNAGAMRPKAERELIKSAVIFGGNATGKSNVLKAFTYMKNVVYLSSAQLPVLASNESFALKVGADMEESLYEVEIVQNGKFYKYGFELCEGKVKREWLYRREARMTRVFERNNGELKITGESAQSINLIKVSDATLFLSIGNNFNLASNVYLTDVMEWFINARVVFDNKGSSNSLDIYDEKNGKYKVQALEILKRADIGITDFNVIKDKVAGSDPESIMKLNMMIQSNPARFAGQIKEEDDGYYKTDLKTAFDIYDDGGDIVGQKDVMLFNESGFNSEGTVRLLDYLGWILAALDNGRVIFIDEIDSRLHFLVVDYIVKLFNSIENNPKNAQLICTAHNVMLMDDGLRRDQIYFTSKDSRGRSTLVSLADYTGVRKTDLFSKRYLAGFYAAIPDMMADRE